MFTELTGHARPTVVHKWLSTGMVLERDKHEAAKWQITVDCGSSVSTDHEAHGHEMPMMKKVWHFAFGKCGSPNHTWNEPPTSWVFGVHGSFCADTSERAGEPVTLWMPMDSWAHHPMPLARADGNWNPLTSGGPQVP